MQDLQVSLSCLRTDFTCPAPEVRCHKSQS